MELGAFDDDYFAYLEDVDFGWRAWIAGYRVLFEPRAVVRHASSTTSNRLGDFERGVLFERNALQTAIKNYENLARERVGGVLHVPAPPASLRDDAQSAGGRADAHVRAPPSEDTKLRAAQSRGPLAAIDDPLTTMQFRALDWILQNDARLAQKRHDVQRRRRRSDREIFERFPLHFVPTYPGDDAMMQSALFRLLRPALPSEEKKLGDIIAP